MSKDLHDIDDLFSSTLEEYKEMPSPALKERLDAALDKQEAEKYKKRFLIWKRSALLLLLLLAGFVLYESGIIKKDSGNYILNRSGSGTDQSPVNKKEMINNNSAGNTSQIDINTNNPDFKNENIPVSPNQPGNITSGASSNTGNFNSYHPTKNPADQQLNWYSVKQDPLTSVIISKSTKKENEDTDYGNFFQSNKNDRPVIDKRINISDLTNLLTNNILSPQNISVSNSPLKNGSNEGSRKKINSPFRPFWMLSPFVSYDQAGYQLDSDEPSAVNSIKFREANEPSFSIGLLLGRQLTQRFSLQSGIVYRNTVIGMKPQKTYAFVDPTGDVAYKYITSSGYAFFKPGFGPSPNVGDSLTTAEAKHTLENISVPLMAKYTIVNKKISVTPGAGIEANFITKKNLEVDIEDPFNREIVVIRKLNGTKPFYLSFIAEADIKYTINKKVAVNIRPVYRQAVSPITKNNVVETFPRSFGIGAGVTIKLR